MRSMILGAGLSLAFGALLAEASVKRAACSQDKYVQSPADIIFPAISTMSSFCLFRSTHRIV